MTQNCGQAMVKLLESYGVDTVFGIPGVHNLELYRGLAESPIRHVLSRHEQGAGFMADGYARTTGKAGVAFVITGPGVSNIATAIGQAFSDSIPMLVVSSVNESWSLGKGAGRLHESKEQLDFTRPVTALSARASSPSEAEQLIHQAFAIFSSARPRPVHIEVPLDILALPVTEMWTAKELPQRPAHLVELERALALVNSAKKPMIIAGGGAVVAAAELQQLAETIAAPVFTSVAAKGVLPSTHSLLAGSLLCVEPGWQMIAEADCVIAVGTELADTDFWRDRIEISANLIRIDVDPEKMTGIYPAKVAMVADSVITLRALNNQLAVREKAAAEERVRQLRAALQDNLPLMYQSHQQVLAAIRDGLSPATVISTDMTQLAYSGNIFYSVEQPNKWLHPTGYGTLGYALPSAIGAAIGEPLPVVVLVGDGGLQYTINELATAAEYLSEQSFIVLMWNNSRLGQIWDDMELRNIEPVAVAMHNPDFELLARGYHFGYQKISQMSEIAATLQRLQAESGCWFVELDANALEQRD
ncbi:5-guanidino-2-oxopentanoate decarboxylase [Umboniibacter marinipuniceus]|uniref:Acetolactate synthase large subunit n=1 Tax=Umboniibacter marinipuniceus TaxID=569599 RepID=A0A3M0AMN4_9GAMM|nr:5-guanidino-2-oxopentanoate decarboxylase [Umboniibacter marinipuniceus]RMA80252.1 acetolactate synthase large subunit [Umboniibacter marinipuniceus]